MEIKGKLLLETAVYGMLAVIYTSLFFFGALYPQFGLPSQSIACESETEEEEEDSVKDTEKSALRGEETESPDADEEETVVYKSLFLERLKEWL
ncbi:MAG: hypothetical protein J6K58_06295 [Lachnospiraceae bacterium]|nr:hypothetical protein [Lachnospiraceae bacterium]